MVLRLLAGRAMVRLTAEAAAAAAVGPRGRGELTRPGVSVEGNGKKKKIRTTVCVM